MIPAGVCPKCGEPTVWDEVDIGVGVQCGPARCDFCGWSQEDDVRNLLRSFGVQDELDD